MQTVRRLYLYLLSGITLGMLAVGLTLLLEVILGTLGIGRGPLAGGTSGNREQLSVAAALIGVGLPVWGIHWFLVERGLGPANPNADTERRSTLRALYLSAALAVLLGFGGAAAVSLLRDVVRSLAGAPAPEFSFGDPTRDLSILVVTASAWIYHAAIRRRDMHAGPLAGAAAWLPRIYLYGAALAGLLILLVTVGELIAFVADTWFGPRPDFEEPGFRGSVLAGHIASITVWGVAWLGHWWYAGRLVTDSGWRGASERPANLRLAFYVAVLGSATFAVVWFVSRVLGAAIVPVLGASAAFGPLAGSDDLVRALVVALASAVPWAIAWWLHLRGMRAESVQADDSGRAATVDRLAFGVGALVGLGFGAVGIGWLAGLLIDVVLGGNRTIGDGWRAEMAQYLSWAVIGFAVWAWNWSLLQRRHAIDPTGEAGSTVRRTYLLIAVAASVVSSLGSLALVLYRLFGALLGVSFSSNAVSELSAPLGALVLAAAIAIYHGFAVRRDLALRAALAPAPEPPPAVGARRALVLSGPADSDLDAALDALRAQLPTGYRLE